MRKVADQREKRTQREPKEKSVKAEAGTERQRQQSSDTVPRCGQRGEDHWL